MKPNFLLVVLDSARAQNMSLYGYERETTPYLERLAEHATVYEQARSPARWSLPSHVSLFTGLETAQHRVNDEQYRFGGETIWNTLSDAGYETGLFSYNVFLVNESFGLRQQFDHVVGQLDAPYVDGLDPKDADGYVDFFSRALRSDHLFQSIGNGLATKLRWLNGSSGRNHGGVYVDAVADWQADRDGPWAACINFMDTHFPYVPRPEHDRWGTSDGEAFRDGIDTMSTDLQTAPAAAIDDLRDLYDGSIRQADALVKRLFDAVDLDSTLVVVTADHGEGFGEPSRIREETRIFGHAYGLQESQLHVPLVVSAPGQKTPATVDSVAALTQFPSVVKSHLSESESPVDFTVKKAYASTHKIHHTDDLPPEVPGQFDGESYALYDSDDGEVRKRLWWNDTEVTIRFDGDKAVVTPGDDLVRTAFDELEATPMHGQSGEISDATAETLEELGYL
jgi:arylsulfatase